MRRAVLRLFVGMAVLPVLLGNPNSPKDYDNHGAKAPDGTALCVVDVGQGAISLGMAGTAIQAAAKLCGHQLHSEHSREDCSAAVNTVLYMFAYTGAFLSSAATNCASSLNLGAYCAADVTNLIGAFAALGAAASSMTKTCELGPKLHKFLPDWADTLFQEDNVDTGAGVPFSLGATFEASSNRHLFRKLDIANCVFHSAFAATFLARAGLALNAAVRDCNPFALHLHGRRGQMVCSVDLTGVIGSIAWTARVLSGAISECPVDKLNLKAMCVADISTVIAAAAGVASSGSSFTLSCGKRGVPEPDVDRGVLAVNRRLSENATFYEVARLV